MEEVARTYMHKDENKK